MTDPTPTIKTYDEATSSWKFVAGGNVPDGGAGTGVTDHGALTGLADDDHPQYLRPAEVLAGSNVAVTRNPDGTVTLSSSGVALPVDYTAPDKTTTALALQGATGVGSTDADQMSVFDGKTGARGTKTFWLNERGNPRARSADVNEPTMRLIQATAAQAANLLEINDYTNAVQLAKFGPTGKLTLAQGLAITSGTLGAGRVLTSDASGTGTWQTPTGGGGVQTRASVALTTSSLPAGSWQATTIVMANGYRLYRVTCSAPARVRLYSTTAQRDADASRALGGLPSGNHGLVLEYIASASLLGMDITPCVEGFDGKTTPDGAIPITISNVGTAAAAITVTLVWVRSE